jgi:signal transduction histidine kinase
MSSRDNDAAAGQVSATPETERLARLAHELRTPLAAIAGMAEIMRDARFGALGDARYAAYAASIADSARHLVGVVEAMLDKTAEARGDWPLSFVEIDLAALAAATVAGLQVLSTEAGLTILAEPAHPLPRVIADRRSVRQILTNLIGNALKFTPRGGQVRVTAARTGDGGLEIVVLDTGPGMGNSPAGQGHGIGLQLSRALAAANGARLVIESPPEGGTRAALVFGGDRVVHG